jgi:DNA replication protein DnaC
MEKVQHILQGPLFQKRPPLLKIVKKETITICSICKGTRWVKKYSDIHVQWKACLVSCPECSPDLLAKENHKILQNTFGEAQIPFQMRNWTFKTFPYDMDQEALRIAKEFLDIHVGGTDTEEKRGLFLVGLPGRCKTGIAICILKEILVNNWLGRYVMTAELFRKLRASQTNGGNYDELLTAIVSIPWLVLDDLAVERPTPYILEELYYIIEKRRSCGLYTIITCNMTTTELVKYWNIEKLPEGTIHQGIRITERIRESFYGVKVKGKNQREQDW